MTFAVIIPTLNEAQSLAGTLASIGPSNRVEVIVADGGSTDATTSIAAAHGARVITVTGGRSAQMNAAVEASDARLLVFVHADTRLPRGWLSVVDRILADPRVALGGFQLAIKGATKPERIIAALANQRSRTWGYPYGDQGLFLRRATFEQLAGFADMPIMEDRDLARRARMLGRIVIADTFAITSPRRWRKLGVVRTTAINQLVLLGYRLGVPIDRLAAFYRKERGVAPKALKE